ncbi:hypothetical protein [Pyrobaculum arsenaticum]|uniref:Uncharacterized protein n=1 Tax=Pyrobaculum arsenaticum TaxID=121277 RepID=A0A7L4P9B1_9CREN|nr:hypothetical protein [Pyrobaculum arsenaticum]NYR15253.1 hypothetical protein [Pyrobaculum arsenaticum]
MNGVQAYNGTAPASGETPQGIPFEIRPGGYYRLGDQNIPPMPWQGWLKFSTKPPSPEKWRPIYIGYAVDKYSVPYTSISRRYTLYVYPGVLLSSDAVDYFAKVGSNATAVWTVMWRLGQDRVYRGFGGASPFLIYEVLAVDNGTRVDIYWYDVRYDKYDEKAVHRDYIIPPGYKVVKAPGGTGMRLLYADANLWVAIADIDLLNMLLAYGAAFDVSVLTFLGPGGVETWVIKDEDTAVLVYSTAQLPRQYYGCYINTNGFRNRFWQWSQYPYYWGIECYWVDLDKGVQRKVTPTVRIETKPLGIWYLNIKVYRDGQLVGDETIYIPWPHPKRILPDYVPIVVTRDNLRTWLWALPAGVSMILGYVPAAQGLAHGDKVYNRAIYGVRITDIASYRYTLDVRAGYNQKLVGEYTDVSGGVTYQLYNVTASGQLTLYLWDQPVAYDAYHGYGYVVAEKPLPPPPIDYFQPSEKCIPTTIYKQLPSQKLTNLQLFKMPNGSITGYKITVERKYLKITQGCGIYQEETVWKKIDTATVDGTTLIVVDLKSKNKPYCSLNTENKPRDCENEVRCECDPGE